MDTSLDTIIGGNQPTVVSVDPVVTEKPAQGEPSSTTGEPAKAEEIAVPPTAPTPKPPEKSDTDKAFAALRREVRAERQKREELERRIQMVNQQEQMIDPLSDPEGFQRSVDAKIGQVALQTRLSFADQMAAEKYADYEELRDIFISHAENNPTLRQEMISAKNPAEFAYTWAKEHKAREEIGDPVQYAEKIRTETIAKTMAEIDKLVEAKVKERLSGLLPSSLADAPTHGGRVTNPSGFNGPTPLNEILKKTR